MYQADISLVNNQNVVYSQHGIENRQCVEERKLFAVCWEAVLMQAFAFYL